MKNLILCLTYLIVFLCQTYAVIIHTTRQGKIKGTQMLTRNGKKFYVFQGIPFAEPPVGELRFQNPQPLSEPWIGTIDATKYVPPCPQYLGTLGYSGNEDCLYITLYTPQLPSANNTNLKLPVWFWIYPGNRLFGDSHPYHYGPEYIMDRPVIFVAPNYRMGVLGFLSTEDDSATGNYGLKDQTMALKWIHDYISDFGGDPDNVTICGESSGAVDAGLHLVSPLSRGLFHKVITQSGHNMNHRAIVTKGYNLQQSWKFAKLVGCHDPSIITSESLIECLRDVPVQMLVINMYGLAYDYFLPHTYFGVNLEDRLVEEAFITEHPMAYIDKHPTNVFWMMGINTDEGSQKLLRTYSQPKVLKHLSDHRDRVLPELLGFSHLPKIEAKNLTNILMKKYTNNKPLNESFQGLARMIGFSSVKHGLIELAQLYKGPIYFYHYDHLHVLPYVRVYEYIMKWYTKEKTGVIHAEELRCLFNQPRIFPPILDGIDRLVSDLVIDMWFNFVAYSNPNGPPDKPQLWTPVRTSNVEYLHIQGINRTMKSKPFWDEYKFWKQFGKQHLMLPDTARSLSYKFKHRYSS